MKINFVYSSGVSSAKSGVTVNVIISEINAC